MGDRRPTANNAMHWSGPMHCVTCGVDAVLRRSPRVHKSCVYFESSGAFVWHCPPLFARIVPVSIAYPCRFGEWTFVQCDHFMVGMPSSHPDRRVMAVYGWRCVPVVTMQFFLFVFSVVFDLCLVFV